MNIQVSKRFADFINQSVKNVNAKVVHVPEKWYTFFTGVDRYVSDSDYDYMNGDFRAIRVSYPENYFACDRYLTTYGLLSEFRRRRVKDAEGLKSMLIDMLEV